MLRSQRLRRERRDVVNVGIGCPVESGRTREDVRDLADGGMIHESCDPADEQTFLTNGENVLMNEEKSS
jgi:hypothetical protein